MYIFLLVKVNLSLSLKFANEILFVSSSNQIRLLVFFQRLTESYNNLMKFWIIILDFVSFFTFFVSFLCLLHLFFSLDKFLCFNFCLKKMRSHDWTFIRFLLNQIRIGLYRSIFRFLEINIHGFRKKYIFYWKFFVKMRRYLF